MSKRRYDRGSRRRMRLYEADYPSSYTAWSIAEIIKEKCEKDPEFKKAYEAHKRGETEFFKNKNMD